MPITVHDILAQPQLQLTLLAGDKGAAREVDWAHTCDLVDPWNWVGDRQLLLTNGQAIPPCAADQREWASNLLAAGVAGVGVGDEMGAPLLSQALLEYCDDAGLPLFAVPYPLPFTAVAQAVAESASLLQAQRLRRVAHLYDFCGRDSLHARTGAELLSTVGDIVDHDIAVVDSRCFHSLFADVPSPSWARRAVPATTGSVATTVHVLPAADGTPIHVVPLPAMPEATAVFRARDDAVADRSLLLHAASVLRTSLSRRVMEDILDNRRHVDVLNRLLEDRSRSTVETQGWLRHMGFRGTVRAVVLHAGADAERELVCRRLQRHGVRLVSTVQESRHLVIAQHADVLGTLEHCLDGTVSAGAGSDVGIESVHHSVQQALWALRTPPPDAEGFVSEFDPDEPWLGFRDPQDAERFMRQTLGALVGGEPSTRTLLNTLRVFLASDRSPQRTAQALTIHRQTAIQRLRKIEGFLGHSLSGTETIARAWVAMTIHDTLCPVGVRVDDVRS